MTARRRFAGVLAAGTALYTFASFVAGIALAEISLHPPRKPLTNAAPLEAGARSVSITSADSVTLRGWYSTPSSGAGEGVILLHGVSDNREGVAGYAKLFLERGYRVLAPDSRAHGASGGEVATYGIREADDVRRWVSWLAAQPGAGCIYALGESMGAAILLQSLTTEESLCAVIAESSFSSFREMAYERAGKQIGVGPWFGRTAARAPIEMGLLYARIRYGINLAQASPEAAIRRARVPVLLIHGAADTNISPWHSEILMRAAHPERTRLWLVPGAGHTAAWAAAPERFETVVLAWLPRAPQCARPYRTRAKLSTKSRNR